MVKTFYLTHIDPEEALERIHGLGVLDFNINWGVDIDKKLNALSFRVKFEAGGNAEEKEAQALTDIEEFLKGIDLEKSPK
jgi:hypothetical protein